MKDQSPGAYNIEDLREITLFGCPGIAALDREYLVPRIEIERDKMAL